MTEAPRIDVKSAHRMVTDRQALLICAYEDERKCQPIRLEHSILMRDLIEQLPWIPKDQRLIFYCT